jgi:hypothetical protein
MKRLKIAGFACFVTILFVVSCRRDDPSWDLDLTAPVAYGSLTIDDLLADSLTSVGSDGAVRITYHTAVPGINADTLFNIPDTTLVNSYFSPFPATLNNQSSIISNAAAQTTYDLGSAQLVYGILEHGRALIHIRNDVQYRMVVTYILQSATLNSVPASISYVVPAATSPTQPGIFDTQLDLSNYEIDFTGLNGDRINTIVTVSSVTTDPTETGTVNVTPADSVSMEVTFSDMRPSYVRGYFGSELIQIGPEESYMSFFSKVQSGQLGLDSIYMTFTLENYAGLDARFTVNNLWSRSQRTGQTVYLTHPIIGSPVNINRATYSYSYPPSIPQIYTWQFNNANSNIVNMFEIMPDFLGYDFSLYTNPLGNVSGNNDFLYTRFGINAFLDVDIPVNFFSDQLVLVDTMETGFNITNAANIQTADLTLYTGNGFPFSANVQLFLLDENNLIVDSMIVAPGLIASAPLTSSGGYYFANGATQSVISIPLNESQTSRFLNSSRIVMKTIFNTGTNPNYVKIFSTNRLDFNLTADFEYRVSN